MLWNHLFVSPQGKLKPCCRFQSKKQFPSDDMKGAFYGPYWQSLREDMLAGKSINGCRRCYQEEEAGKLSLRQRYNKHPHLGLKSIQENKPEISWLEIPFSNRCNLACRMCDSRYSTKWLKDEKQFLGKTLGAEKVIGYNWDDFPEIAKNLKHIKITGGEPLIDPHHDRFLDILVDQGNAKKIYLNYSTNMTVFPSSSVLEKWKHFEKVEIALSLDSCFTNELNYIRYPTDGESALKNVVDFMKLADQEKNIYLILRSTVSAYNIFSMPETLKWWLDKKQKVMSHHTQKKVLENPTHLTNPEYLAPCVLPDDIRLRVNKHYKEFLSSSNDENYSKMLNYLLQVMNEGQSNSTYDDFIKNTQALDKIRKQNYLDVFPFLKRV